MALTAAEMVPGLRQGDAAERYLDVLKRCLTRLLFIDEEVRDVRRAPALGWGPEEWARITADIAGAGLRLVRSSGDPAARSIGREWPPPSCAETMVSLARLDNVQHCVTEVIRQGVPGDLIEAGVWRGGTTILMRAVLAAYGDNERRVWAADSFEGLPKTDPAHYPSDAGLDFFAEIPELAVDVEQVKANFARYGLLDAQVEFLVGWFKDTLPAAPIHQLAVARIDGDLYESTIDAISALYPRLSVGGYLIVDDYNDIKACRHAISDYRVEHGIDERIEVVDWTGIYWQKLH